MIATAFRCYQLSIWTRGLGISQAGILNLILRKNLLRPLFVVSLLSRPFPTKPRTQFHTSSLISASASLRAIVNNFSLYRDCSSLFIFPKNPRCASIEIVRMDCPLQSFAREPMGNGWAAIPPAYAYTSEIPCSPSLTYRTTSTRGHSANRRLLMRYHDEWQRSFDWVVG